MAKPLKVPKKAILKVQVFDKSIYLLGTIYIKGRSTMILKIKEIQISNLIQALNQILAYCEANGEMKEVGCRLSAMALPLPYLAGS